MKLISIIIWIIQIQILKMKIINLIAVKREVVNQKPPVYLHH